MKAFELSIATVILRFYLMMLVVIVAGFIGQWWLAILALPIFLSIMTGMSFSLKANQEGKIRTLNPQQKSEKRAS